MPLPPAERKPPVYQLLSTQRTSPRATLCGPYRAPSAPVAPGPSEHASLRNWATNPHSQKTCSIGAQSLRPARSAADAQVEPTSMLGTHLRSQICSAHAYDPPPGMGDVPATRARGAVMVGSHARAPIPGSAANSSALLPSPLSYASEYGTMGWKASKFRSEAQRGLSACTFGSRPRNLDSREGFPGPGAYDEDFTRALSPLGPDDSERNRTSSGRKALRGSRPTTVQSSFTTASRGVKMSGRNWATYSAAQSQRETEHDSTGPGPSEYTLPSISSGRTPTLKFRAKHPFVDSLALHECARSQFSHDPNKRFRATPRLQK